MALRESITRHTDDPLDVQQAQDQSERDRQWRVELDERAEREISWAKLAADGAAGDTYVLGGYRAEHDHEVARATVLPFAAVAAGAAFATLRLERHRGGGEALSAGTTVAVVNTQITAWTARRAVVLPVNAANARVRQGDWVLLSVEKTGGGVALPGLVVSVTQKRRQEWR